MNASPATGVPTSAAGHAAGTLLAHEPIATSIKNARAWRVRYVSQDVNDVSHEVTGLVIAPTDEAENRPILTWCHGTTGIGDAACPSLQPDPARELVTYFTAEATQQIDYGVPGLQGFIDAGWVVCATDYQGLGTPGVHQYTVNRTNARDAVNIAHAARQMGLGAGTALGCIGWSQGGGAAAAVAELDEADYADLHLVGTVTMSPGVAKFALEHPASVSTALKDPSVPPDGHLLMLLAGVQAANPSTLALSDVLTPLGVEIIEKTWNTQPVHHLNDTVRRLFTLRGAVLDIKADKFAVWRDAIFAGSAANRKPVAPVLLCMDTFHNGTVIPVAWQTDYAEAVKGFGGAIDTRTYPHDDHFSLPQSCVDDARAWLAKRFG